MSDKELHRFLQNGEPVILASGLRPDARGVIFHKPPATLADIKMIAFAIELDIGYHRADERFCVRDFRSNGGKAAQSLGRSAMRLLGEGH